MTGPDGDRFQRPNEQIENAAVALDAYQHQVVAASTVTHRQNPLLASILLRALLDDLACYADRHGLGFDDAVHQLMGFRAEFTEHDPRSRRYEIGEEVRIRADAADDPRLTGAGRGFVTAIGPSGAGSAEYTVRFPGAAAGEFHLPPQALEPASAFPRTTTRTATVTSAADAEKTLVTVAARVLRDIRSGTTPSADDLADRDHLAAALAHWAGGTGERLLFSLGAQISRAAARMSNPPPAPAAEPARLAAEDFPYDLAGGVPENQDQHPEPMNRSTARRTRNGGLPPPSAPA